MRHDVIDTFNVDGLTVRILYDPEPESPREWSNLGTMACWHRRYNLGDWRETRDRFSSPEDFEEWIREQERERTDDRIVVRLPLYLYDHSGITISTGSFSCPWDSGQVGWIYVTRAQLCEEYSTKRITKTIIARATEVLEQEVKTYDEFITGQVYGYQVLDSDDGVLDSCWGFFGLKYARTEAKTSAEYTLCQREKTRDKAREEYDDA